jgi:hypothetical protein
VLSFLGQVMPGWFGLGPVRSGQDMLGQDVMLCEVRPG